MASTDFLFKIERRSTFGLQHNLKKLQKNFKFIVSDFGVRKEVNFNVNHLEAGVAQKRGVISRGPAVSGGKGGCFSAKRW